MDNKILSDGFLPQSWFGDCTCRNCGAVSFIKESKIEKILIYHTFTELKKNIKIASKKKVQCVFYCSCCDTNQDIETLLPDCVKKRLTMNIVLKKSIYKSEKLNDVLDTSRKVKLKVHYYFYLCIPIKQYTLDFQGWLTNDNFFVPLPENYLKQGESFHVEDIINITR